MIIRLEELGVKCSLKIAQILAKTPITPYQITIIRFLLAVPLSVYFFTRGTYWYNVLGLFCYVFLAIFDWVDGRLAEIRKLPEATRPIGKFTDHTLDRILMLMVLGSIFYAGIHSAQKEIWIVVCILYFMAFFFTSTMSYEFEKITKKEYYEYHGLEQFFLQNYKSFSFFDRFLWNVFYLNHSSFARIFFMASYMLFLGIIINQLLLAFILILSATIMRGCGIFIILYRYLKPGESGSHLIRMLRTYKNEK